VVETRQSGAEDHADSKAALRAAFTSTRRARTPEQIEDARAAIREVLFTHWGDAVPHRVAAYVPLRTEPGSVELLEALVQRGSTVLIPVVIEENDLDWQIWSGEVRAPEMHATAVPESLSPAAIATVDAVLVPALAVAENGTRLGRGGGSYDRALTRVTAGCPVIALLYEDEVVHHLPRDAWDQPVTAIVTPLGWRELDGPSV
jgi:5-formyltetrahydrofolate cyclo-ligase